MNKWLNRGTYSIAAIVGLLSTLWWIDGTRTMRESDAKIRQKVHVDYARAPSEAKTTVSPRTKARSTCLGAVNRGSLENGWKLPEFGPNFETYSGLGALLGRTYVHSSVHEILLTSYADLEHTHPQLRFIYGETGFEEGGRFRPHRTHQNGTSVDFMTPVLRRSTGEPAVLPTSAANEWGYGIEFDAEGNYEDYAIDFEAISAHLHAVYRAAQQHGIRITKVVLHPPLRKRLSDTKAFAAISHLPFTQKESWVRHDDHYHVDFDVPCAPLR